MSTNIVDPVWARNNLGEMRGKREWEMIGMEISKSKGSESACEVEGNGYGREGRLVQCCALVSST